MMWRSTARGKQARLFGGAAVDQIGVFIRLDFTRIS